MGRSTERMQDSQLSVWTVDADEPPLVGSGWLVSLTGWQRQSRSEPQAPEPGLLPTSSDLTTTAATAPGRGQLLRTAHRALRDRLRAQRDLRRVLPHLYFIERSLARQGSAALQAMPVWVLQRGLRQLSRLPADNLGERVQFSVLQQRLVEAIQARSVRAGRAARRAAVVGDSFIGGPDSHAAGGLEVSELPPSVFEELMQSNLALDPDEAVETGGWQRG